MVGRSRDEPGGGGDEHLLVAARTDSDAFLGFYDRRYRSVAGFFYRRTLCPHTTAELTAETFARVWATRARFDPAKGTALGWTMGVARNVYRQWSHAGVIDSTARRRLSVETPTLVLEDLDHIERLVDMAELRQQLRDAIDHITPKLRDAVLLRVAMDLPYDQVAERLGCSPGAARVRVSRGLDALFGLMEGAE